MSTSFGYLNKFGYGGHKFPIVIGEAGSYYTNVRLSSISTSSAQDAMCLHVLTPCTQPVGWYTPARTPVVIACGSELRNC